jgi:hypothetical protein
LVFAAGRTAARAQLRTAAVAAVEKGDVKNKFNAKTVIKTFSILICLLSVSKLTFGAGTNETMTKIVHRDISTNLLLSSFAAQPRTLYRMGEKYNRLEEAPDPVLGIHGLIIINEPDAWMINLMDKTGTHMVDGGPTYVVHDYIVSPPDPIKSQAEFQAFETNSISGFEFGKEMEFLKKHKAKKSGPLSIDGVSCDRYELPIDGYLIELFAKNGTETPFQLKVSKEQTQISYLRYDTYRTDLQPDLSLFKPPAGIEISEARH